MFSGVLIYLSLFQYSVEGAADEEDSLDYGVLSELDFSSRIFTVHNVNPVEVCTVVCVGVWVCGSVCIPISSIS